MAGVKVDCAADGQQALEWFLSDKAGYDLILMDVQMPVMNGYQVAGSIRRFGHPRAKTIPILAKTANDFHEDVVMTSHLILQVNPHISPLKCVGFI